MLRTTSVVILRSGKATLLYVVTACLFTSPARALDVLTEENPPFNYSTPQRITGISTDILLEMGKRANVPLKIQVMPWARAYLIAQNLSDTCVYSTVRLPEREALFKWVGPLSTNRWMLFAKSDFNKPLQSIEDAKHYRIGGMTMDARAMYLKSLGIENIELVPDNNLNMAKLLAGRIDLWIAGLYKGKESPAPIDNKAIKPVLNVRNVEYYLACNLKTSSTTLDALKHALDALRKEGFIKLVQDRYIDHQQ